jgi:nucleoside-diphosphate-sugar epimerase
MRAFVTGATGFVGGHVAGQLRARGDDVVALVRTPSKAGPIEQLGCELVSGDLSSLGAIRRGVDGADAVFHVAAAYELGVPKSEHARMYEATVRGTENVLDAAIAAGVPRIVYVSTVGVYGNTHGVMVDESYVRPDHEYLSYYEETKVAAHTIAKERIAAGAPVIVVLPGGVYGPGDVSAVADVIDQASTGKLKVKAFADAAFVFVHVEDLATGILLAHDKGKLGESYILGGEQASFGQLVDTVSELAGRTPPRFTMPTAVMKLAAPLGPLIGPRMGYPPNLHELVRTLDGATYWGRDDKARRELGFNPRPLRAGLEQTLAAM